MRERISNERLAALIDRARWDAVEERSRACRSRHADLHEGVAVRCDDLAALLSELAERRASEDGRVEMTLRGDSTDTGTEVETVIAVRLDERDYAASLSLMVQAGLMLLARACAEMLTRSDDGE